MYIQLSNLLYATIMIKRPNTKESDEATQPSDTPKSVRVSNSPKCIDDVLCAIIHQTPNFVVISKPHDVRMDGNFNVTVEKLMYKWLNDSNASLKWVHQLDYATSGVLCVGLNRDAAALASLAFAERKTSKQYLALLQGHLDISKYPALTVNEFDRLQHLKCPQENTGDRNKKKKYTSIEMQTLHDGLKVDYNNLISLQENVTTASTAFASESFHPMILHGLSKTEKLSILSCYSYEQYAVNTRLRKALRKILKEYNLYDSSERVQLSDTKKTSLQEDKYDTNQEIMAYTSEFEDLIEGKYQPPSGSIYRQTFTADATDTVDKAAFKLVITIPVAEIAGDFRCIPNSINGKAAYTELEVLEYGTFLGAPVTKVKFTPISGRRHQLRVHSTCLGHAIVGDGTYNTHVSCDAAPRMMLHALSLKIPFPQDYNKFLGKKSTFVSDSLSCSSNGSIDYLVDVTTQDPFTIYP